MVAVKKDKVTGEALGTGRRKSSIARVRIKDGSGKIVVNGKPLDEYFPNEADRHNVLETLAKVELTEKLDITARVVGGGTTGQSGAIRMGLARALVGYNDELYSHLREGGFMTRDSRMKERKKYGLHGARRGTQFSKR